MHAGDLVAPARRRVLDALRVAGGPLGVNDLAEVLGLHRNTVRLHLAWLVETGLVVQELEPTRHRGRPGYRYRPAEDPVAACVRDAGRAIGRAEDVSLLEWFERLGFVPRRDDDAIVLTACPFIGAGDDLATICSLHLGLAEGVAERHGEVIVGLDADPGRCRFHVQGRPVVDVASPPG